MVLELIKTAPDRDTVGDLFRQNREILSPYDMSGSIVMLAALPEDIVAEILPVHCGAMLLKSLRLGDGRAAIILLNERLVNVDYREAVQATMPEPDIADEAATCGFDMCRLLLFYTALASEYGHIDLYNGGPFAMTLDWLKGYAGQMMWFVAWKELEPVEKIGRGFAQQHSCAEAREVCGDQQQQHS